MSFLFLIIFLTPSCVAEIMFTQIKSNVLLVSSTIRSRKSTYQIVLARSFAIQELPWCAPKGSPNRRKRDNDEISVSPRDQWKSPPFGIVAAMSSNGIIGVEGNLPWNLPRDRKNFVELTRGKILIIGRKTFEERPNRSHIEHAKTTIVVSKTLELQDKGDTISAKSFSEAVSKAHEIIAEQFPKSEENGVEDGSESSIHCWVAGGQRLYHEALLHPFARILYLSVIDITIDESKYDWSSVAKFPEKYKWDNKFKTVRTEEYRQPDQESLGFTTYIYKRLRGLR